MNEMPNDYVMSLFRGFPAAGVSSGLAHAVQDGVLLPENVERALTLWKGGYRPMLAKDTPRGATAVVDRDVFGIQTREVGSKVTPPFRVAVIRAVTPEPGGEILTFELADGELVEDLPFLLVWIAESDIPVGYKLADALSNVS